MQIFQSIDQKTECRVNATKMNIILERSKRKIVNIFLIHWNNKLYMQLVYCERIISDLSDGNENSDSLKYIN